MPKGSVLAKKPFDRSVFVNCPFDDKYSPLLEAMAFCLVDFGLFPRLASERLEAGEVRLEKIVGMIKSSKYSIHDLSRCKAENSGDFFRMNMPFELGIDLGLRQSGSELWKTKKFLIFEENRYDLKRAISDIAGQDVECHRNSYQEVIKKVRNYFRVEANLKPPGTSRLISEYATFQGWMIKKKEHEGHSFEEIRRLPSSEKIDEMRDWVDSNKPARFTP